VAQLDNNNEIKQTEEIVKIQQLTLPAEGTEGLGTGLYDICPSAEEPVLPTKRAARSATVAATPNAKMSVYTRFGDSGKTALYAGKTVSKASQRINACGAVDELNSAIGLSLCEIKNAKIKKELISIQKDLFEIGASLASNIENKKLQAYLKERVREFEKRIDILTKDLTILNHFILPGGGKAGSFLHLTRTICRRAEREVVALFEREKIYKEVLIYMNRLSDLLFTYARFINHSQKKKEIIWYKK